MSNSKFDPAGISNGLVVEANQVSQSVDAFMGNTAYDIYLSGSLTLTGSLNLTGSLINEYSGQFKTLGIGTQAPTEPMMLHIKTTDAGGDPLVLIEASAGANDAIVNLQNDTLHYELGVYGHYNNDFKISQGPVNSGIEYQPFTIKHLTADYTMYLSGDSVGVGLGISTPGILSFLEPGSLQASGMLSGSTVQGNVLSASDQTPNTVNIHGTASYANYIETSISSSYIQATNIDFSTPVNTITSPIVSTNNFTTDKTSSFGMAKMGLGGISTGDLNGAGDYKIISGSSARLYIGDLDNTNNNGTHMEINSGTGYVYLKSNGTGNARLHVDGDITATAQVRVSGSTSPAIVVGPTGPPFGSGFPKLAITPSQIAFDDAGTSIIGNFNPNANAQLALAIDNTDGNDYALVISRSLDVRIANGPLIMLGAAEPSDIKENNMYSMIGSQTDGDYCRRIYRVKPSVTTAAVSRQVLSLFKTSQTGFPSSIVDENSIYNFKFTMMGVGIDMVNTAYLSTEITVAYNPNDASPFSVIGSPSPLINRSSTGGGGAGNTLFVQVNSSNGGQILFLFTCNTNNEMNWDGVVELEVLSRI